MLFGSKGRRNIDILQNLYDKINTVIGSLLLDKGHYTSGKPRDKYLVSLQIVV